MHLHQDQLANKLRQGHEALDSLHRKLDRYLNGAENRHTEFKMLQPSQRTAQTHYYRPGCNNGWQGHAERFSGNHDWPSGGMQTASTRAPERDRNSRHQDSTARSKEGRSEMQGQWPGAGQEAAAGTVESHSNRPVVRNRPQPERASGSTDPELRTGPRPDDTLSAYGITGAEHSSIPAYLQNSKLFPNGTEPLINQNSGLRRPAAGTKPSSMLVAEASQERVVGNIATKQLSEPFPGAEKGVNRSDEFSEGTPQPNQGSDLKETNPRRVQMSLIKDSSRDGLNRTQLSGSLGRLGLFKSKNSEKMKPKMETFAQKIKRAKLKGKREQKGSASPSSRRDLKSGKKPSSKSNPKSKRGPAGRTADKKDSSTSRRARDRRPGSAERKPAQAKNPSQSHLKNRPRAGSASHTHAQSVTLHRPAGSLADISGLRIAKARYGLNPVETGIMSYLFMRDKLYPGHRNHIDLFVERLAHTLHKKPLQALKN